MAEDAGVKPPVTAITLSTLGLGGILGTYYAYLRYVDEYGNYSNLSPISASLTAPGATGAITGASNTAPIVITSTAHGLTTGATVFIDAVLGNGSANGQWTIIVIDANTFSLTGTVGDGAYTGGGTWSTGSQFIIYNDVESPSQGSVTRRQILRNTNGQAQVFYVDVDTDDLTSSSFRSAQTDVVLATQQAQALFSTDTPPQPLAQLNTVPPDWKRVIAPHLGRMFAAVEVPYTEGCVAVTFGGTTVKGTLTEWKATFVGRVLAVVGASEFYDITAVDVDNQVLTLGKSYADATNPYAAYAIRPSPGDDRNVYFSEAGLPESWPPFNAIQVQEDEDVMTGLMVKSSFLYILERNHIYRFTFQTDPAKDGYIFPSARRGCVNHRCWVVVEDIAYLLDEAGVYGFDGAGVDPLSVPIQDLFENEEQDNTDLRINWAARDYFHCCHYPGQQTIRWFVALSGQYLPRHALVYDYRLKRWWLEEFPFAIGASALGRIDGRQRCLLGGPAGRCYVYGQGWLDGPSASDGTVRGTATSATPTSLTDTAARFPAVGLIGSPVVLVDGRGKGQQRIITAVSGQRLEVGQPWSVLPDTTTVYQLGGVEWLFKSGWFRFADGPGEMTRRLEITFEPCRLPALIEAQLFLDRSEVPLLWDSDYSSAAGAGVRTTAGSPNLTGDLTKSIGFLQKRLDGYRELYSDGPRYVQLGLSGASNGSPTTLHAVTLDGATQVGE